MNTKHTPAPWKYKSNHVIGNNETEVVAQLFGFDKDEKLANAKLIAAAPELLEALSKVKNVLEALTNNFCSPELMYVINKAIKKATE